MNNSNFDLPKEFQTFIKHRNDLFRKNFGNYIKPNLLIRLKEEIKSSPEFKEVLQNCYDTEINFIVAFGVDDVDFDICSNLALINWYLNLNNSDEKKSDNYKNQTYCAELKKRTILQCRLRKLVKSFGENNSLLAHTPINYAIHCLTNHIINCINKHMAKSNLPDIPNAKFRINTMIVMATTLNSILSLTEINDCGNAFALLRTLIETTFVYLSIYDNENAAEVYYKFMEFRNNYEMTGEYPTEFLSIVPKNTKKQNFLNYGWIDSLSPTETKHNYTFKEVVNLSKKTNPQYNDHFLSAYKHCCKYVHGNYLNQGIDKLSFIWILEKAGNILVNLSKQISYIFGEESIYNNINLEENLIKSIEETHNFFNCKY